MNPTQQTDHQLASILEALLAGQPPTIRDLYAANALAHPFTHAATKQEVVRKAYQLADAMIEGPTE